MAASIQNKVMHSNKSKLIMNGELLTSAISASAKADAKYDSMEFIGDNATYYIYAGYEGKGAIKFKKKDSKILSIVAKAFKTGVMPDITIITSSENALGEAEKVALKNIQFENVTLFDFEAKKVIEEDFAFNFSDFEILQTID